MNLNDDLFQLIKAMSRTEKRYFKLDAQKSGEKKSKQVQLFDAINNMDSYDEQKLAKKSFVKHLAVEKNSLYSIILRSLRSYRSDRSAYAQIKEMTLDANYLLAMGLTDQSSKLLKKAKKNAYEVNYHLAILEINKKERHIAKVSRSQDYETQINLLTEENEKVLGFINEEMEVLAFMDQLYNQVIQKMTIKDLAGQDLLQKKFTSFDLNEDNIQSTNALLRYYSCKTFYYILLGDYKQFSEYQKKIVDWWNQYPKVKKEEFTRYIGDLANLINAYLANGQYLLIPPLLDQLAIQKHHSLYEKKMLFYIDSLNSLTYYMNTCKFDQARALVPKIQEGLKNYRLDETRKNRLMSNITMLWFVSEDYQNTIDVIHQIIKIRKTNNQHDLQYSLRIIKIICLYELQKQESLESEIRAVSRFFNAHTNLEKENYESLACRFLKKISEADAYKKKQLLQEFSQSLQKLSTDPTETKSLGFEEVFLWVKSKIHQQPIIQYMNERIL